MENNIDKLFRDKLKNRDIEFNDKAWKQAKLLLDKDSKDRGGIAWLFSKKYLLYGVAFMLLLGFTGYNLLVDNDEYNKSLEIESKLKSKNESKNRIINNTFVNKKTNQKSIESNIISSNNEIDNKDNNTDKDTHKPNNSKNTNYRKEEILSYTGINKNTNRANRLSINDDVSNVYTQESVINTKIFKNFSDISRKNSSMDKVKTNRLLAYNSFKLLPILGVRLLTNYYDNKLELKNSVRSHIEIKKESCSYSKWDGFLNLGASIRPVSRNKSVSAGLGVRYNYRSNWGLSVGVNMNYEVLAKKLELVKKKYSIYGFSVNEGIASKNVSQVFSVDLPIMLEYYNCNWGIAGGVGMDYAIVGYGDVTNTDLLKTVTKLGWVPLDNFKRSRYYTRIQASYRVFSNVDLGIDGQYRIGNSNGDDSLSDLFNARIFLKYNIF